MKGLPRNIEVGGKRIKIRVVADLEPWAEYHHDLGEIRVAKRTLADHKLLLETLRHELMHASLGISGVGFAENMDEESVVRCMDEIFFPAYGKMLVKLKNIEP